MSSTIQTCYLTVLKVRGLMWASGSYSVVWCGVRATFLSRSSRGKSVPYFPKF